MNAIETLSRIEMRNVKGGVMQEPCRIFINGHWSGCEHSVESAQSWYNSGFPEITGYCCASCADMCY